jgi:hypothetical protein
MTDDELRERRRQFLLMHAYHPDKDFPEEFAKIAKLLHERSSAVIADDDLRFELTAIKLE